MHLLLLLFNSLLGIGGNFPADVTSDKLIFTFIHVSQIF